MSEIKSHRDLLIWRKAMELALSLYEISKHFPAEERFGLISQIRRAAVSVPSNIAEGQARHSGKEFSQFLYIAKGSLAELDTQCTIAQRLNMMNISEYEQVIASVNELQRMIYSLIDKLGGTRLQQNTKFN